MDVGPEFFRHEADFVVAKLSSPDAQNVREILVGLG
jgi:hypothetical protein